MQSGGEERYNPVKCELSVESHCASRDGIETLRDLRVNPFHVVPHSAFAANDAACIQIHLLAVSLFHLRSGGSPFRSGGH
jgi:hypothetical protein